MNNELFEALDQLEKEKGIPKEYMLEKVEAALVSAYKREHNSESNVRVVIDNDKREIKMYQLFRMQKRSADAQRSVQLWILSLSRRISADFPHRQVSRSLFRASEKPSAE